MEERLANQKIASLLLELSIPAICGQIISLVYSMADRMYIGHLPDGTLAMAAIGLCVPLTTIIGAFSGLFGRGGSPLSSIALGEGDKDKADRIMSASFISLIVTSVLVTALVLIFCNPLLYLFGASEDTVDYAKQYMTIYALGTVFMQLTLGLNYFINTQGFTRFAMVTTLFGAGLNIVLDPIFIFALGLGVRGAAIATVLSQGVSCLWVLKFLFSGRSILHVRLKYLRPKWSVMKEILVLGASPCFMNASEGLLTISFNQQLLSFGGSLAVSSMTIMTSMFELVLLPIEGVAAGSQPIISYNYGAKNFGRVRETIKDAIFASQIYSMAIVALMVLFPGFFIGIFTKDPELMALGSKMLRVYIAGCCVIGINTTLQQTYNSLAEGKKSLFFAFLRKIILLIPLIFILPVFLPDKTLAVMQAEPLSDLITTAFNSLYFKRRFIPSKLHEDISRP